MLEFDASESTFKESINIEPLPSGTDKVVSAASAGDNLLVICKDRNTVNIFNGKHWKVHDGPYSCRENNLQVFIHNCTVFLAEWLHTFIMNIYKTSLQSLHCDEPRVWQVLRSTLHVPILRPHYMVTSTSNLISLGNHLCIVSYDHRGEKICVWYYSVNCEGWLELGNVDSHYLRSQRRFPYIPIVGLPDGTLIMFMGSMLKHYLLPLLKLKPEGKAVVLCMIVLWTMRPLTYSACATHTHILNFNHHNSGGL